MKKTDAGAAPEVPAADAPPAAPEAEARPNEPLFDPNHEWPVEGGSYVRQSDGTLKREG